MDNLDNKVTQIGQRVEEVEKVIGSGSNWVDKEGEEE